MCKPVMVKQNQRTKFGHSTTVEPVHCSALSFVPCFPTLLSLLSGCPRGRRWDGARKRCKSLGKHGLLLIPTRRQPHWSPRQWASAPCLPAGEFPFHPDAPPQPEIACDSLSQIASITCDSLRQPVLPSQPISGHLRSSQPISGENEIPLPRGMKTSVTNM